MANVTPNSDGKVTAPLSLRYGFWAAEGPLSGDSDGSDGKIPTFYIPADSFLLCLLWRWNKRRTRKGGRRGVCVQSRENAVIAVTADTAPWVLGPPWPPAASTATGTAAIASRLSFREKHCAPRATLLRAVVHCRQAKVI